MSKTFINIEGMTAAQVLDEARKLINQRPQFGEPLNEIEQRRIAAAWLITEADFLRVREVLQRGH